MLTGTIVQHKEYIGVVTESKDDTLTLALNNGKMFTCSDSDVSVIIQAHDVLKQFREAICLKAQ